MKISGWFEVENGVQQFDITAANMTDAAEQFMALDDDAGHTDMEATNQMGDDFTAELWQAIDRL